MLPPPRGEARKAVQKSSFDFIIILMVFVGGGLIAFTFYAFVVFSRFLNKEKAAAERFRAEHGGKRQLSDSPEDRV